MLLVFKKSLNEVKSDLEQIKVREFKNKYNMQKVPG